MLAMGFETRLLGRTGLKVGRLGVAASYGVPAAAVERAVEQGVNYLYWGSMRRSGFADAIRNLAPQRERLVVVVQSYSRIGALVGWSVERALKALRLDYADVLLLGIWNRPIPPRILDACRSLTGKHQRSRQRQLRHRRASHRLPRAQRQLQKRRAGKQHLAEHRVVRKPRMVRKRQARREDHRILLGQTQRRS